MFKIHLIAPEIRIGMNFKALQRRGRHGELLRDDLHLVEIEVRQDCHVVSAFTGSAADSPAQEFSFTFQQNMPPCIGSCPSGAYECVEIEESTELVLTDVISGFDELLGGTSKEQQILYVDMDKLPFAKAYEDDPVWWQYYRSFWDEDGTKFVNNGIPFKIGSVRDDCQFERQWNEKVNARFDFEEAELYSTQYCTRSSLKYTNRACEIYLVNHYRGRIGDYLPGVFSTGPTYSEIGATYAAAAMNFQIWLDELIETFPGSSTSNCQKSGYWRTVVPGEVTPDGWGIVPQSDEPQGEFGKAYFNWLFIAPKGAQVRVGPCLPVAQNCTDRANNIGDVRILDPPLSLISPEEQEARAAEKYQRMLEESGKGLGGKDKRMRRSDYQAEGAYLIEYDPQTNKWKRGKKIPLSKIQEIQQKAAQAGMLTVNGSGNRLEPALRKSIEMAVEAGKSQVLHIFAPVSVSIVEYTVDNLNSDIPDVIESITDWAFSNNVNLDIRGHSWGSYMIWRGCAQSQRKCEGVSFTSYAPAALPWSWREMRQSMTNFKGTARIVVGAEDWMSGISLGRDLLSPNPGVNNLPPGVNVKIHQGAPHDLLELLKVDNCPPGCRLLAANVIGISPEYKNLTFGERISYKFDTVNRKPNW